MTETVLSKNGVPIRLTDERWLHISGEHSESVGLRSAVLQTVAEPENHPMATAELEQYLKLVPAVRNSPQQSLWSSYDDEADVLYINFKQPSHATDSELTEDDVIVRCEGDEVIGLTVLHASRR